MLARLRLSTDPIAAPCARRTSRAHRRIGTRTVCRGVMSYTLHKRGDVWHVYCLDRYGRRRRASTRQTDKKRADVVAADWYRKLGDPTHHAADTTTIQSAAESLIEALKQRKRSPATIGHFYRIKLSHIARLLGAHTALAKIDARTVDSYIADRDSEGASSHTVAKELTALRMLLKHARRRGEFDKELSQVMPVGFATGYKPRERRVTESEAWAIIGELPDGAARYVAFVCATTGRDLAAKRAKGRDLTPEGIRVHDRKTKQATRTVPLTAVTEAFARHAFRDVAPDAPVAEGLGSVRHALRRACARLKLAPLSPNDFRRSVAHWLLERGVPRDAAAAFMGHGSTKMLDLVYGKLDTKELGATIRRALEPRGSTVEPV
jgi:integrase